MRYEEDSPKSASSMTGKSIAGIIIAVILLIGGLWMASNLFEHLDNSQIMVVQSPIKGELTWYTTTGGIKWQGFGTITKYDKRCQFWFSTKPDQGKAQDESIRTRFNDGAHADISGSFSWSMPSDQKMLTDLHTKFGNQTRIEQELIRTVTEKAIYMTGPLMSSAESYSTRRNDLLNFVADQMDKGIYRTEAFDEKTKDSLTGQEKTIKVVKLVKEPNGQISREDVSPLDTFGIKIFGLSFNQISYEERVEKQIQAQQQAIMEVQTSMANAKKAEQAVITAEKSGEAEAAKSKWEQEVIKAREVTKAEQEKKVAETQAEQRKNVAAFDLDSAKLKKDTEIALGEGESQRKKLVMAADGALEKKLEAYVSAQKLWSEAYAQRKVPSIVMGNAGGGQDSEAQSFMQLMTMKTA